MKSLRKPALILAVSCSALLGAATTHGATYFWDGGITDIAGNGDGVSQGGDGIWNQTIKNWDVGASLPQDVWVDGNSAVFGGTAGTVLLGAPINALGPTFSTGGYTITPDPINTLTIGTGGIAAPSGTTTIGGDGLALGGAQSWTSVGTLGVSSTNLNLSTFVLTVPGAGATNISSVIGGSGGFIKIGTGTLLLSGNNTFTGGITFNGGASNNSNAIGNIRLASNNALGAAGTAKIIAMQTSTSGAIGAVELIGGVVIPSNKTLTVGGRTVGPTFAFLRNVSGNNTWSGAITISNSGGGYSVDSVTAGDTLTLGGTISNGVASSTRGLVLQGAGNYTISGAINNGSGTTNLTMNSTGIATLTNANNFSGGTTISKGTLIARRTTQVALGTGAVGVSAGANLTIQDHAGGGQLAYTNNFTLTGSGVAGNGALGFFNSGAFDLSGTIAISGGTTIRTDPNNQTLNSTVTCTNTISGSGGLTLFAQGGSATGTPRFTFSGASGYTGGTILTSGGINTTPFAITLTGADDRLPAGTALIFGGTPAGAPAGIFNKDVTLVLDGISQQAAGLSAAVASANANGYSVVGNSATLSTLVLNNAGASSVSGVTLGSGTAGISNANNLALRQQGAGTLTVSGTNTYTGGTVVASGSISGATDGAFGAGSVSVQTAAVSLSIQTGVLSAVADTATLSLEGGGTLGVADFGFAELQAGVNEIVGGLFLGGILQTPGIYGSSSSGAPLANQSNEYFSGTGTITVVPEPGSAATLLVGLTALLGLPRLRRRLGK